jgi:hypothetical protein
MSNGGDYLSLKNRRALLSFLAGIGVETLYTLCLVGIGALVLLVLRLFSR